MLAFPHDRFREAIQRAQSSDRMPARLVAFFLALAVVMIVISGLNSAPRTLQSPSPVAITAAHGMLQVAAGQKAAPGLGGSEMPGYPLLLVAMARLTPGTADVLACWANGRDDCKAARLGWIIAVQLVVAVLSLWLSFRLALLLSRNIAIAALATVLTFFAIRSGGFAGLVRGHIWYGFFLLLYLQLLLAADAGQSWRLAAGSGLALGLAALLEPLAVLLIPISGAQLLCPARRRPEPELAGSWLAAPLFVAAAIAAAAGPLWFAMAHGFDGDAVWRSLAAGLGQRVAFTSLERSSLLAGIVQPIPVLGDVLSGLLPASELRKFSVGAVPGSLVHTGGQLLYPEALARVGGSGPATLLLLLREHVLAHPVAYLASLVPVLMRGLFAGGGVIALAGLFHVRTMLRFARAESRLGVHLLIVVPVAVLLVGNVLLTGNAFWLNPMLPFVYAYAIAYVAGGW